jgi:hypothetical protein
VFTNKKYTGWKQNYNVYDPGAFKHCTNDIQNSSKKKEADDRSLAVVYTS